MGKSEVINVTTSDGKIRPFKQPAIHQKVLYCIVMRLALLLLLLSLNALGQVDESLRFIENKGQWDPETDFQALVPGGRVGISASGFAIQLLDMDELDHQHMESHAAINESNAQSTPEPVNGHFFRINLINANRNAEAIADLPWEGYYNYFLGRDSCSWAQNARAFASVVYKNVYDGIDFRVSSVGNNLKYDFIVRPGADPSQIRIQYAGADRVEKSGEEIKIFTSVGALTELKPFSYHLDGNARQAVPSQYQLQNNIASFYFPDDYDECRELIIDPLLIFSTYSGSTADNWGSTATPGEHGTLYSAGVTKQDLGGAFPTTTGAFQSNNHGSFDMAIIKYDSAGTKFLYATHLGGANNDSPTSLVVDSVSGDLIVLGISSSPDYPTSGNAFDNSFNSGTPIFNRVFNTQDQWDIVLTRLSRDGDQLIGSTFLGGAGNDGLNHPKQSGGPLVVNYGDEMRGDVITDDDGNVYITSVTASNNFPIVGGFDNSFNGGITDGVVVKLAPDLSSIHWSSYLGGSGFDAAYSIRFDGDGNVVLAGGTTSTNFPVTTGAYQTTFNGIVDGWITRVAADGTSILAATYTGTSKFDQVYFIDLNSSGSVFCYGQTTGNIPITPGVYHNANSGQFLQKFSADLQTLELSTVFGSGSTTGLVTPNISPTAFLVNDCDNIYMAGWGGFINSSSTTGFWQSSTHGMPITSDAHQKTTSGSDFYFMVLNGDATQLVYATYFGGNSSKTHVDGGTSRFDKYGIVYHAVCSGCSFGNISNGSSSDFPTTPNAKSRLNRSQNCNNAAFKFDLSSLRAMFETNNTSLTMPGFNNVCYPDSIVFENLSTGGKTIEWDLGDGTVVIQDKEDPRSIVHQYQQAGQYLVKLKITDLSTCSQTDSTSKVITYFKDNIIVGEDATICDGEDFRLTSSGGVSYTWYTEDGSFSSTEQFPVVRPGKETEYHVTVVDVNGCMRKDTLKVTVTPNVLAAFQTYAPDFSTPGYNNVCYPEQLRFKNQSTDEEEIYWDFGDGVGISQTKSDTSSILRGFEHEGVYHVKLKATNPKTCNKADSVTRIIHYYKDKIEVGPDGEVCEGTEFQLTATGGTVYAWYDREYKLISSAPSVRVKPAQNTQYFVTVTDAHGCIRKDTTRVTVIDSVNLEWDHRFRGNCSDLPSVLVKNLTPSEDEVSFVFDFGDGTTSMLPETEHFYEKDGLYALRFSAQKSFCIYEEVVQLPVYRLIVPNVFTPDGSPGFNDNFEIRFGTDTTPQHTGMKVQLLVLDRWGKKVFESKDYQNNWDARDVAGGVYFIQLKIGELDSCKGWVHIVK